MAKAPTVPTKNYFIKMYLTAFAKKNYKRKIIAMKANPKK
jgi:hypothetical protein